MARGVALIVDGLFVMGQGESRDRGRVSLARPSSFDAGDFERLNARRYSLVESRMFRSGPELL
jgi:hypothetical protein